MIKEEIEKKSQANAGSNIGTKPNFLPPGHVRPNHTPHPMPSSFIPPCCKPPENVFKKHLVQLSERVVNPQHVSVIGEIEYISTCVELDQNPPRGLRPRQIVVPLKNPYYKFIVEMTGAQDIVVTKHDREHIEHVRREFIKEVERNL